MKKLFAILFVALLIFSSCDAPYYATEDDTSTTYTSKQNLSVKIFQTLDKNSALARTSDYDVVKLVTMEEMYYDGKKITGTFVLVDTYTYETKKGDYKTVPVYIRYSEYKKENK